jgi:hypothetical protein
MVSRRLIRQPQAVMQAAQESGHGTGLIVGQEGGEVLAHAVQVYRGGSAQPLHPVVGHHGVDDTQVFPRRLPPHQAGPPHPPEQPGEASRAVQDGIGEIAHLQSPAGRLGESQQDIVLGQGDARSPLHLPLKHRHQPVVRKDEVRPGTQPDAVAPGVLSCRRHESLPCQDYLCINNSCSGRETELKKARSWHSN